MSDNAYAPPYILQIKIKKGGENIRLWFHAIYCNALVFYFGENWAFVG